MRFRGLVFFILALVSIRSFADDNFLEGLTTQLEKKLGDENEISAARLAMIANAAGRPFPSACAGDFNNSICAADRRRLQKEAAKEIVAFYSEKSSHFAKPDVMRPLALFFEFEDVVNIEVHRSPDQRNRILEQVAEQLPKMGAVFVQAPRAGAKEKDLESIREPASLRKAIATLKVRVRTPNEERLTIATPTWYTRHTPQAKYESKLEGEVFHSFLQKFNALPIASDGLSNCPRNYARLTFDDGVNVVEKFTCFDRRTKNREKFYRYILEVM